MNEQNNKKQQVCDAVFYCDVSCVFYTKKESKVQWEEGTGHAGYYGSGKLCVGLATPSQQVIVTETDDQRNTQEMVPSLELDK